MLLLTFNAPAWARLAYDPIHRRLVYVIDTQPKREEQPQQYRWQEQSGWPSPVPEFDIVRRSVQKVPHVCLLETTKSEPLKPYTINNDGTIDVWNPSSRCFQRI